MRGYHAYHEAQRGAAEARFRDRITALGGTVLGEYVNAATPVAVRCASGHMCQPRPNHVQEGIGICRACIRKDPAAAEAAFRAQVISQGGTVLGTYVNVRTPILVMCRAGHEWRPKPYSVQQGQGICGVCAEWDPVASWAAFAAHVTALGGTVLEPGWVGSRTPVHVRCKVGHDCWPTPGNVRRGRGICRRCAGHEWDAFYVVSSSAGLKFGITSGDPRPRLGNHRTAGYRTTVRLLTGLPGDGARQIEQAVIAALRLAEVQPVRGREHFDIDALPLILDIVDNYPINQLAQ